MAFGDVPSVAERARRDDAPYQVMVDRGELRLYPGPCRARGSIPRLTWQADLAGSKVSSGPRPIGYKAMPKRKTFWIGPRCAGRSSLDRVGAGKDGGADVRAFQRLVLTRKLRMIPSVALVTAITKIHA